jgi:hypothetical protein
VRFRAATTVGLECTLRHYETALLTGNKLLGANRKYIGFTAYPATSAVGCEALSNANVNRSQGVWSPGFGAQAATDTILHRSRSNEIFFSQ